MMACKIGPPADQTKQQSAQAKVPGETSDLQATERRLQELSERLRGLIQADADAYAGVVRAYRLPKTDPARPSAIATSLRSASEVPLETATLASETASLLRTLLAQTKPTVAPDLKVGLLMARAAIEGGLENVYANLKSQTNQSVVKDLAQRAKAVEQRLVELKSL